MSIYEKLAAVQHKVKFIQKNSRGQFSFLNYMGLMNELYPHLYENDLYMYFTSDVSAQLMTCKVVDIKTGETHEVSAPFPETSFDSKNPMASYGKKITYIRRYLICMMFNIVTDDDDGEAFGISVSELQTEILSIAEKKEITREMIEKVSSTGFKRDFFDLDVDQLKVIKKRIEEK